MNNLNPSARALRSLPRISRSLTQSQCLNSPRVSQGRRFLSAPAGPETNSVPKTKLDPIAMHRLEAERKAYYKRRTYYSAAGFVAGMVAIWVVATSVDLPPKPAKLDAGSTGTQSQFITSGQDGKDKKVVIQKMGEDVEDNSLVVETGTSSVPTFPRLLEFADTDGAQTAPVEYQLIGLGIRTVSFLSIQVYVVGMYIATDDIAALQQSLIRRIDPIATTLVAGEKETLRLSLLDPVRSEEMWSQVIKDSKARTLMRIVPTRNTDFSHIRDAWVRALQARAARMEEYADEAFGKSVAEFKVLFGKGNVPKGKELLLARNKDGVMAAWYDDGKGGPKRLGAVGDERVSRAVWLNYLGGKTVASEGARISIVDGVLEFVERPVGSVATQVHV